MPAGDAAAATGGSSSKRNAGDGDSSATTRHTPKRRRLDSLNLPQLLATPHRLLTVAREGGGVVQANVMHALCNCVVSAANGKHGLEDR
jgi:hypothetical protein